MALADYYARGAVAASQVIAGFDEAAFRQTLEGAAVGITVGRDALATEGNALTDLLTRIAARLYPTLVIRGDDDACTEALRDLALAINPAIEFAKAPTFEILVGADVPAPIAPICVFVGSSGWDAHLSPTKAQPTGASAVPFGAGAAACLAAANAFRAVFLGARGALDQHIVFSTFSGSAAPTPVDAPQRAHLARPAMLAGCGAIGNAAVWALARADLTGLIDLIDAEPVDLGNLQRYVITRRADVDRIKVELAAEQFMGALRATPRPMTLADFLASEGYDHDRVLLALDSARDRRQAQAALPRWIANAWTQPGDLGVSVHAFGAGACVWCLYLPEGQTPNEDQLVAGALQIPERLMEVRQLLHTSGGVARPLLEAIATKLGIGIDALLPFEGKPIRTLYIEGMCAGAVVPLGRAGLPAQDVHVPLAHQSALAGVLLAAALMRDAAGPATDATRITRIDLMRPLGTELTRPAQADPRGDCICQDADYLGRYAKKFGSGASRSGA